jgi:RNA polymerase sigma-70 factor (ECF subfamily)
MNAEALPDEELMKGVAAGRPDLLAWLVRRYSTRLLTFLVRLVVDRHRAEELFQDVFLTVWLKRQTYTYPRPLKPWLYAIALNKCREVLRKVAAPVVPLANAEPEAPDGAPDAGVLADETSAMVLRAVGRLPPQQRAVVMMRVWDEMPYAEIGEALGCVEATVRSHMHLALAALRKELEGRL